MTVTGQDVVRFTRLFLFVREQQTLGQNEGQRVNAIQLWSGGRLAFGTSWCAWFVTFVLDILFQGNAPIPRLGSCETIYGVAQARGWLRDTPEIGDLFLYVNDSGRAHHVGIVTSVDPLVGIAGNTSADGSSSNGDGVYEHGIDAHVFVHYL